jgi:L-seryl-tRNA(Ser) seleniumtransferase
MGPDHKQELLRRIPSVTELLKSPVATAWLAAQPQPLVADCLRRAAAELRQQVLQDAAGSCGPEHVTAGAVLARAGVLLAQATTPHVRAALNATGIILHTGLGRAVFPAGVVDSMLPELKGYATLAVDPATGERAERDELVEYILTELTGAEAATVVNNNAAATLLVLAALAAPKEVLVSRGQLIEIGGSFRLPEVMAQSGARLVEVGATNRTHLKDYRQAFTADTAAIMRVHPSNYRIVGFTSEPGLAELVELAHARHVILIDDLGAGALVDLERFGLPHEPTVGESIRAGADVVLFSGDKLIGASQAGIVVGRKALIDRLRRHPLMRAVRADKTCLMVLERTLQLFRDPERLRRDHPTYRMIGTPPAELEARARELARLIAATAPRVEATVCASTAYLGSGSLPTEALPSFAVRVAAPGLGATELARRLRLDAACVFGRIEDERVWLDVRTLTDAQLPAVAAALGRSAA